LKVVFRTDSSLAIGTGHLMRCLTLAGELASQGAEVSFVCRDLPGNMNRQAEENGHRLYRLPYEKVSQKKNLELTEHESWLEVDKIMDAEQTRAILSGEAAGCDLLVVDHYALDLEWERLQRPLVGSLMVIDDLADRPHDCDLLLDQNLYENYQNRYHRLVGSSTRLLLGPVYVLLRDEFREWRGKVKERDGSKGRVLVFFGGADRTNETMQFLQTQPEVNNDKLDYVVVAGKTNPHSEQIEKYCASRPKIEYHRAVDDMARLMAEADLAVGAGGTSTWERCCMGLPAVTVAVAENQVEVARLSQEMGFAVYLGTPENVTATLIKDTVTDLFNDPEKLKKMSTTGMKLVDGQGVTRVCNALAETVGARKHS
jgi:UDP-2,4-diacetamido-2,4,6-trideoxy-beta-L-altropyranose hydrolase